MTGLVLPAPAIALRPMLDKGGLEERFQQTAGGLESSPLSLDQLFDILEGSNLLQRRDVLLKLQMMLLGGRRRELAEQITPELLAQHSGRMTGILLNNLVLVEPDWGQARSVRQDALKLLLQLLGQPSYVRELENQIHKLLEFYLSGDMFQCSTCHEAVAVLSREDVAAPVISKQVIPRLFALIQDGRNRHPESTLDTILFLARQEGYQPAIGEQFSQLVGRIKLKGDNRHRGVLQGLSRIPGFRTDFSAQAPELMSIALAPGTDSEEREWLISFLPTLAQQGIAPELIALGLLSAYNSDATGELVPIDGSGYEMVQRLSLGFDLSDQRTASDPLTAVGSDIARTLLEREYPVTYAFERLAGWGLYPETIYAAAKLSRATRKQMLASWMDQGVSVTSYGVLENASLQRPMTSPVNQPIAQNVHIFLEPGGLARFKFRMARIQTGSLNESVVLHEPSYQAWQQGERNWTRFIGVSSKYEVLYLMPWGEIFGIESSVHLSRFIQEYVQRFQASEAYYQQHPNMEEFLKREDVLREIVHAVFSEIPSGTGGRETLENELRLKDENPFERDEQVGEFVDHAVTQLFANILLPEIRLAWAKRTVQENIPDDLLAVLSAVGRANFPAEEIPVLLQRRPALFFLVTVWGHQMSLLPGDIPGHAEILEARRQQVQGESVESMVRGALDLMMEEPISVVLAAEARQVDTLKLEEAGFWKIPHVSTPIQLLMALEYLERFPGVEDPQIAPLGEPGLGWRFLESLRAGGPMVLEVNKKPWTFDQIVRSETFPPGASVVLRKSPANTRLSESETGGLEENRIPIDSTTVIGKLIFIAPDMAGADLFESLRIFKGGAEAQLPLVVFAKHEFHAEEIQKWLDDADLTALELVNVQKEIEAHAGWDLFDVVANKQAEYYLGMGADVHTVWFPQDLRNLGRFLKISPVHLRTWQRALDRQYGTQV